MLNSSTNVTEESYATFGYYEKHF